jgi:hypothetical protein
LQLVPSETFETAQPVEALQLPTWQGFVVWQVSGVPAWH